MTVTPTALPVISALRPGFGATCFNVDLNKVTSEQFAIISDALNRYKVLIIKNQPNLRPDAQLALNRLFDPNARSHGAGTPEEVTSKKTIISGKPAVSGVDDVRIVGRGVVPEGHYGSARAQVLMADSHEKFHKYPLSKEEISQGDSRFFVWHTDCSFYPKNRNCSTVTTFWAHTLPKGPDVSIRFDDETGAMPIKARPGCTAFVDGVALYESLAPADKLWVEHSYVEYAPSPFDWNKDVKVRSNGLGLDPDDVAKLADLNQMDVDPKEVQILPLLWPNPVTGERALMVQAPAIRKLHLRTSPDTPFTILDEPAEVWKKLYALERPFFREENILFAPLEEGDLAVWNNRSVRHTSVDFPQEYGPRIAHQCHLVGSYPQATPAPFSALPW